MQQSYNIIGMTCAACAQKIEKVTSKLNGVETSNVNFATEKLHIKYDENLVSNSDIQSAIKKAGYETEVDNQEKQITIPISGMTCAACANKIEKTVNQLDGVSFASVNFATEKISIKYDPTITRISTIKSAIIKIGYTPLESVGINQVDEGKMRKEKEIKVMWIKFVVSIVFSLPLLYISMAPMITLIDLPLPMFLNPMM